ncbi:MAG: family 1 glycosylhydrolase [Chitinophagaceae bacterium]|nr:family 1 glycosylhydrolase [Chitinophagaceae bacterium]
MDKKQQLTQQQRSKPELWGGLECTINRVGDKYRDQLELNGHYNRPEDIDCFAKLGIKALRYPVLWEKHEPEQGVPIDWNWVEQRLYAIRSHGIKPIAGLVHHGSGPRYTDLLQSSFAEGLAAYASKVAEKFPWIEYYTPVNEPLTTARFSGLYGCWYPHKADAYSFAIMLLNEVKATVLCMKAIRKINPDAKLIQTDDLGKIYSTRLLKYQADFENERRWITFDLLCGKVNSNHKIYKYFVGEGVPPAELQFFLENPCPPDIMGLNYYVTSERYLDEDILEYPEYQRGGNHRHQYADTEAVRTEFYSGPAPLIREAWDRFHIPIAITEAHIGDSWDEQLRWLKQIHDICCSSVNAGVDIRAVTAWSLLGAYDWHNLLTKEEGIYERGVFDCRSNPIHPTALANLISALARGNKYDSDVFKTLGWWQKEQRLYPHLRVKNQEYSYAE